MKNFSPVRYTFGRQKEIELLEKIQLNLGETILAEHNQYSLKDYTSFTYNIELKSRRSYSSDKFSEWLCPACKFKDSTKPLVLYYFWEGDATLWRYNYNKKDLEFFTFRKSPISDQDHYDIPKRFFELV